MGPLDQDTTGSPKAAEPPLSASRDDVENQYYRRFASPHNEGVRSSSHQRIPIGYSTSSRSARRPSHYDDDHDRREHDPYWTATNEIPRRPRASSSLRSRPPRADPRNPGLFDELPAQPGHVPRLLIDDVVHSPYLPSSRGPLTARPLVDEEKDVQCTHTDCVHQHRSDGQPPRLSNNFHTMTAQERSEILVLPWTTWMHSYVKNHVVAALGELIGTTMFLFLAFAGTMVSTMGSDAGRDTNGNLQVSSLIYIALSFGFSLMVNVWVFFRISGALFNPAITLGMWLVQAIPATRAVCLFVAQLLGSLLASVLAKFVFPNKFAVSTQLGGGAAVLRGLIIEALLTAELVFTVFMLAKEKHRATFLAPVGIGLALFVAELVGVQFTGGSLNPARSFGPCVIVGNFESYHWIYWIGPAAGALIAVTFYKLIKSLEYEMANPGQDADREGG